MTTISISLEEKNKETVLTILENLKEGLILNIETKSDTKLKHTQYKPKHSGVIYEHESGTNDTNGKYSLKAYKERLKKK